MVDLHSSRPIEEKRRFFTGGAGKERKKLGAAGAGRRPGRNGEAVRRIWRISRTFDHLRRRAWGRVRVHRRKQAEPHTHVGGREKLQKGCTACVRVHRRLHDYSRPARRGRAAAGGPTHATRHSRRNDARRTGDRAARAAWVRVGLLVEVLRPRSRRQRRARGRRGHGASARRSPTRRWPRAAARKRAAAARPRREARRARALRGEREGGASRARAAAHTGRVCLATPPPARAAAAAAAASS